MICVFLLQSTVSLFLGPAVKPFFSGGGTFGPGGGRLTSHKFKSHQQLPETAVRCSPQRFRSTAAGGGGCFHSGTRQWNRGDRYLTHKQTKLDYPTGIDHISEGKIIFQSVWEGFPVSFREGKLWGNYIFSWKT